MQAARVGWIAAVLAASGVASAQSTDPITVLIGAAGPLSGSQAALGIDQVNGVRMAVEELNRRQLVIGGHRVTWKLDVQDDQADPKQATAIAQKFIDEKVNGVVAHLNSGATLPAARIYSAAGMPQVAPSATAAAIAKQGFKTFFRMLGDDGTVGIALARYARDSMHAQRVVVVDDRTAYGQGLADGFVAAWTAQGGSVLAREYTSDKATDFSAILTRLKALHPDVLMYGGAYPQAGPMLRQMRHLGLDAKMLGGDLICAAETAKLAGPDAVAALTCAEGGVPVLQMPGGRAWKQAYDQRFGSHVYQIYSPFAYDAMMVMAQAMIKADSVEPAGYLRYIRDIDYDGVTKQHIHFTEGGNLAEPMVTFSGFTGGVKTVVLVTSVQ